MANQGKWTTCKHCGKKIGSTVLGIRMHLRQCRPEAARAIRDEFDMVVACAARNAHESKLGLAA